MQDPAEIALTDDECRLGFSVQTLTYPEDGYELSGLRASGISQLERTVALTLDDAARIRRRRHGTGYVLEGLAGGVWTVSGEFASLEEVAAAGLKPRTADPAEEPAAETE